MIVFIIIVIILAIVWIAIYRTITKARILVDAINNKTTIPPTAKIDVEFYTWCIGNENMLVLWFNNEHPDLDVSTDQWALVFYSYCEAQYNKFNDAIDSIDSVEEYKRRFKSD